MILAALIGNRLVHCRTWPEIAALITEILGNCGPWEGYEPAPPSPGTVVSLTFGDRPYSLGDYVHNFDHTLCR